MQESTYADSVWWLAKTVEGSPVAYAGLYLGIEGQAWLVRAGVLKAYRGGGLQRHLIRVRVKEARRRRLGRVLTYTSAENLPSQRNLIRCGFLPYRAEGGCIYFEREAA